MADPFDSLHQPRSPMQPRPTFVSDLRRQLQDELHMTAEVTDRGEKMPTATSIRPLLPAMTYIRTDHPDRSIRFFAELFGWEAADVGGVQYVYNVEASHSVRTGHRGWPMPVLEPGTPGEYEVQFAVDDLAGALATIEANGGTIFEVTGSDENYGYASADDGQGLTFVVWRSPGPDAYPTPPPSRRGAGSPIYFRLEVPDPDRAASLYRALLDWNPTSSADGYAVVDEGRVVASIAPTAGPARLRTYLSVEDVSRTAAEVIALGGTAGVPYTIGERTTVDCTDSEGSLFRLIEVR